MNFKVSSGILLKNLTAIGGVVSSSPSLPILECFLFDVEENKLKLTGSDLQTTMTTEMEIESEANGRVCIPAPMILDVLRNLPEQDFIISVDEKQTVTIEYFGGVGNMAGFKGEEYPKNPPIETAQKIELDSSVILRGINKTLPFTGNDELRQFTLGVNLRINGDKVGFAASDGFQISTFKKTIEGLNAVNDVSLVLPKKPLTIVKNILQDGKKVIVSYNENNAIFEFDGYKIICRLIDAKYPDFERMIPQQQPFILLANKMALAGAIKRVTVFGDRFNNLLKFDVKGQSVKLQTQDIGFGSSGAETMICKYHGEDILIGFNSKFVSNLINTVDTEEVQISFTNEKTGSIIRPVGMADETEEAYSYILPMMIASAEAKSAERNKPKEEQPSTATPQ